MQTNHKTLKHPGLRSPGFLDLCTTAPSAASYKERLLSLSSTSNIAATKNTEKKAMTSSKVDASIPQPPPKLQVWDDVHLPSAKEKLIAKSKETPFVPIGIAGTLATLAYGVYAYRKRGPMSTSRYIMKFRVLAQGAIVGAMIIGATLSSR